jgi:DNA-binding response OmpR family regulator
MRILCVEGSMDDCEILRYLLKHAGYEVVIAHNFNDGLELARQTGFRLIILDNWVEEENGVELCKEIRGFDARTPILFFSGAALDSDIEEGISAGAQAYLT